MTYEGRKQFHETMISLGKESPYAKEFEGVQVVPKGTPVDLTKETKSKEKK